MKIDELQGGSRQLDLGLAQVDTPLADELLDDDRTARAAALDTGKSFIVRAPAGSGKTELLTQRVLALLAEADAPEEIVAVTFTRKAAAEMKDRLFQALSSAGAATPPAERHRALTLTLAQRVLARDRQRGWELTANPSRLRVQTIDALAQWLGQQMPITTRFAATAKVIERAEPLYAAAASATLRLIDSTNPHDRAASQYVARLLSHLDNDWMRLHRLLSSMLARRDQWLRYVGRLDRGALEAPMQRECQRQIERVCAALPAGDADELIALARYAAGNLDDARLSPCADLDRQPDASHQRLDAWCGLASLVLTKEGTWRIRFNKSDGFPAIGTGARFKQRIEGLMDRLRSNEPLRQALHGLRELPAPHFTSAQWSVLESIVALLPRAAAELMLVFAAAGETDFVQLTRSAVEALGENNAASDVAHALDARVRHLLVDEFQDTSITQFELIERLIADWQPADGRTVFVVGDPMQSIYRFREAEVGLFLRAWNDGIAALPLLRLTLARNYRSQRALIDWANASFERVMPAASDMASGAVAFEPSVAEESAAPGVGSVTVHALIDQSPRDEATRVVEIVQRLQADDPAASIALLVRARPHVAQIVPALRDAGIRYTAVELELLLARPLIGDLFALTRALEHLADKVGWLAVLRAPWCGLTLADLAAVSEGASTATVWQCLCDSTRLSRLSVDGQQRLARATPVLARALELRGRSAIAERVRETWWLLGGPACVASAADYADADSFFDHLMRHEEEGRGVLDLAAFETSLARLHAAPDPRASGALQVMTIHKAKGLEFDHVLVPGLGRAPMGDDAQLMQFLERPAESIAQELLLSPIYPPTADKKEDSIYCWIERLQQQRQAHEDARLLYVAATRARRQLHWLACIATTDGEIDAPRERSLLQQLWPAVEEECRTALAQQAGQPDNAAPSSARTAGYDQTLRWLQSGWEFPLLPAAVCWHAAETPPAAGASIEFSWAGETARHVGIVVHRWLQRIADDEMRGWNEERVRQIEPHVERELGAAGIGGEELKVACARIERALVSAISDRRAHWLFGPQGDARSELRLTVRGAGGVKRIVIDRTFVDQHGARWIVDYKTGIHEGADTETFLDREQQRYRQQLENYAAAFEGQPQLGLYFPLVPGWREWSSDH